MTYFLSPAPLAEGATVTLTGEEARHLLGARRMRPGERFALQGTDGRRFAAELVAADRRSATVRVLEPVTVPALPPVAVTLLLAAVKDKAADWMVQKATELGVAAVGWFPTEHGTVPHKALNAPRTLERWERIAWEACKQCDRQHPPTVSVLRDLPGALAAHPVGDGADAPQGWLLDAAARDTPAHLLSRHPATIRVLVGPEGGWSDAERALAREAGYRPVRLGATVLRAETAALAAAALALWGAADGGA